MLSITSVKNSEMTDNGEAISDHTLDKATLHHKHLHPTSSCSRTPYWKLVDKVKFWMGNGEKICSVTWLGPCFAS